MLSCLRSTTVCLFAFLFVAHAQNAPTVDKETQAKAAADLKARIEATPELPFHGVHFAAQPSGPGWESGMVSWMALGANGIVYELQRGEKADPVLVLDRNGKVLRSWGRGD